MRNLASVEDLLRTQTFIISHKRHQSPVWIPKYQKQNFFKGVKQYAENILSHTPSLAPDIEVIKVNIHMLKVIPPRIAVANVVQFIKTHSAKMQTLNLFFCKKKL